MLDWATTHFFFFFCNHHSPFRELELFPQTFSTEELDLILSKETLTWKMLFYNANQVIFILHTLKPFLL